MVKYLRVCGKNQQLCIVVFIHLRTRAVVPRPFEMHGRRWDGWYHPVIGDSHRSRFVNKLPEMEDMDFGLQYRMDILNGVLAQIRLLI